jgi:hypothetical protein
MTLYPNNLFNPDDVVNSYMALDCVTQVPEEFFNRNDKYGMAYSMEGRFPFSHKKIYEYTVWDFIHKYKIGAYGKNETIKLPTKLAYKNRLIFTFYKISHGLTKGYHKLI